jgi:superfamily II helicase
MNIKLITGYHLTAERKYIAFMLQNNIAEGMNKIKNKHYKIERTGEREAKVIVGTLDVWTIGGKREWQYSKNTIQFT